MFFVKLNLILAVQCLKCITSFLPRGFYFSFYGVSRSFCVYIYILFFLYALSFEFTSSMYSAIVSKLYMVWFYSI